MSRESKQLIVVGKGVSKELQAEIEADAEASLEEMMAGIDARPPQIQIVHGNELWTLGDNKPITEFRGIVVANVKANAYWHQSDDIANPILLDLAENHNFKPPFCSSLDGITGSLEVQDAVCDGHAVKCFGQCGTDKEPKCFLNQFGTARSDNGTPGDGKACKNGRRMVVFVEGFDLPFLLTLPPSSIIPFDTYITGLRSSKTPLYSVWTKFGLESKTKGQQKWSVFSPGCPEKIDAELTVPVYNIRKTYKGIVTTEITDADFEVVEEEDDDPKI